MIVFVLCDQLQHVVFVHKYNSKRIHMLLNYNIFSIKKCWVNAIMNGRKRNPFYTTLHKLNSKKKIKLKEKSLVCLDPSCYEHMEVLNTSIRCLCKSGPVFSH